MPCYENREYKIGEFAAMTGMSPSKVRFYEKAGLFPYRRHENGYRYFTPLDAFRANAFKVLQTYGFSVEEAIRMLDEKQGSEQFRESLQNQRKKIDRDMELLSHRRQRVDATLRELGETNSQRGSTFTVIDASDRLYVRASSGDDFSVSERNRREIAVFYDLLAVTTCCRIIAKSDFDNDEAQINPTYVIAMPVEEAWLLEGADIDASHVHRLSLGKCLRFRRKLNRAESLRKSSFDDMFSYLADHGYRLRDDIFLQPMFLNLDGLGSDVEILFAPIE